MEDCLERGTWKVCRFEGVGVSKKKSGGGVFEGGLIPQCTLCFMFRYTSLTFFLVFQSIKNQNR